MKAWRVDYAAVFNVSPLDMPELYPHQVLEMDERLAEMARKARNGGR